MQNSKPGALFVYNHSNIKYHLISYFLLWRHVFLVKVPCNILQGCLFTKCSTPWKKRSTFACNSSELSKCSFVLESIQHVFAKNAEPVQEHVILQDHAIPLGSVHFKDPSRNAILWTCSTSWQEGKCNNQSIGCILSWPLKPQKATRWMRGPSKSYQQLWERGGGGP